MGFTTPFIYKKEGEKMITSETIFENDDSEIIEYDDTDNPNHTCFGVYQKNVDPEYGGQKEICYIKVSASN